MEASPNTPVSRTSRYRRCTTAKPLVALTPIKRKLLRFLVECRVLSLPQLISLGQLSPKGTRRQMRQLFDAGLVEVVAVSRAALAPEDAPADATLLYGSAPNLYVPTTAAVRTLVELGIVDSRYLGHGYPAYSPKNGLFLRHELLVRDVRVWLEGMASQEVGKTLRWEDGTGAALELGEKLALKPDAWFVFEIAQKERPLVLVGLVEVDRGTERGKTRWAEKLTRYHALFSSDKLLEHTGYKNARVLVLCPDDARRERLSALIAELAGDDRLAGKFWLITVQTLSQTGLHDAGWLIAGQMQLCALL